MKPSAAATGMPPQPAQSHLRSRLVLAAILITLFSAAASFWWLSTRNKSIAFLSSAAGAEWILFPKAPEGNRNHAFPLRAIFRHTFLVNNLPPEVLLHLRVFKSAQVQLNGHPITGLSGDNDTWKLQRTAAVTEFLRAGTNEIVAYVTNNLGPPALWLRLQGDPLHLGTDESWQVSLAGSSWQPARRAAAPLLVTQSALFHANETTLQSLRRTWPIVTIFFVVAIILVMLAHGWLRKGDAKPLPQSKSIQLTYLLLLVVLIARVTLFANDLPRLPRSMGFDAEGHEQYIEFIQKKHALPLAKDGWEMYQPPLYYLGSALVLGALGLSIEEDQATSVLRAMSQLIGLVHCCLALLALRLLFPGDLQAQAVGLLVCAFIPPHLYLSQYVSNETLAGLFVTLSLYFCLRALVSPRPIPNRWLSAGIGLSMGAALLTKFSSLLGVALIPMALAFRLLWQKKFAARDWLGSVGIVLLSCLLVCGWHYARVSMSSAQSVLPNWESDSAGAWWQDPGFQTRSYYFRFGQSLFYPLFSGFHSFADGIYSTLWGDGLISGAARLAFRPPWNYDLMAIGYLLALALSTLAAVGLVRATRQFVRQPCPVYFVIIGMMLLFGLGLIYFSLRAPWLAHVKAFFAFPCMIPFSALIVLGWKRMALIGRFFNLGLWILLIVWTMTVFASFWIRDGNSEAHLVRGLSLLDRREYGQALETFDRALQLNPGSAEIHFNLGLASTQLGQTHQAIKHYREALHLSPESPAALNNLAWILAANAEATIRSGTEAVPLAKRACDLTLGREPLYLGTLAAAYAEAGQFGDCVSTAEQAIAVAENIGRRDLAKANRDLLELYRTGKAFHEPAK